MKYQYIACAFVCILSLFNQPLYSQPTKDVTLEGTVRNDLLKPIANLTVSIVKANDTLYSRNTLSSPSGGYKFTVSPGRYYVKISGLSYKPYRSALIEIQEAGKHITVPDILLEQQSKELEEVVISQRINPLEMTNGKLIYNVEKSAAATGASALELLQRTPGVSVDQNESILLKGSSGVNIMIDGKTTYLSSQQLTNMLKGMNAANISRIEVANSPSAQFDAAGNAGVINIITKKNTKPGYAADISAGAGFGHYFLHRESITANIKNERFNIFGNIGYDHRHSLSQRSGFQLRQLNGAPYSYHRKIADEMQTHYYSYRVGLDLYVKKGTELGFVYNGYTDNWSRNAGGPTRIFNNRDQLQSLVQNSNVLKEPYYNNGLNLNFKTSLDTAGKTLSANADYVSYKNNSDGYIANSWNDLAGNELQPYQQLNFHQPSHIDIRSIKTDLELPFKKIRILSGLKYSSVTIDNDFRYDSLVNNSYVFAPSLSDHFVYKEQISAAYLSAEKKWGQTTLSTGLRLENTISDANSISSSIRNLRKYTDLFPSLSMERTVNDAHKFSASFSRRINRPVYSDLNPVRYFSDKYAYFEGNPNLRPEKAWITSLSYSLNDKYIATLSYKRANNFISQSAILDNSTGILITSQDNFSHRDRFDLLLLTPVQITSFWNSSNTFNLNFTRYPLREPQGLRSVEKVAYDIISSHTLDLPGKSIFEIMAHYTSPTLNGVYVYKSFFSIDGGFKRSFLKTKLDARLAFSDLFRTIRYQGYTITSTADNQYSNKPDSRRINFTLIYHIGGKVNRGRTQNIEEQQRL